MAETSNPSEIILSITRPALISLITCGLIKQHEQLLNRAGELSGELTPKKKLSSLEALIGESEP